MQTLTAVKAQGSTQVANCLLSRLPLRPLQHSAEQIELLGTDVSFATNAVFYDEGDSSTYLYRIVTGVARSFRMTVEGRRQIIAFYVPGDLFGFEVGDTRTLSAEAVTNMHVRMIKRTSVIGMVVRDDDIAKQVWLGVNREIRRSQEHILQFSCPARARVASFLLEMARRIPTASDEALLIPRRDIADYLGLRIETVSRTMVRLAQLGIIALTDNRKITIRKPAILERMVMG